jgi:uncharacterized protein (TIGR03084 family)
MKLICQQLRDEYDALDNIVEALDESQWQLTTGFKDWSIYEQICHLCISDESALLAVSDPEGFKASMAKQIAAGDVSHDWKRDIIPAYGQYTGSEMLLRWRQQRSALLQALSTTTAKQRIPWIAADMSARSFATARLMETWSHGQGIYDALGLRRKNHSRLKNICELGYRTFGWSFVVHGQPAPEVEVRLELVAPSGELWIWGAAEVGSTDSVVDAVVDVISGSAEGFCQVVCQCRHVADTDLVCRGDIAVQWMALAQCFAGGPGGGPQPGERKTNVLSD